MKPIRALIALAIAVSMLAASVEMGALVLCFGSDGHVTVEAADAWQRCVDSPQQASETSRWTTTDACEPCNDVELFFQSANLAGLSKKTTATTPLVLSEPVSSEPLTRTATLTPTLPAESPVAVSLRTIVLLV